MIGPSLAQGEEGAVYADNACDSRKFRDGWADAGIQDSIMHKTRRNTPLKNWQRWFNKAVSAICSCVERGFVTMKWYDNYQRVRDIGLARNRCQLTLMCVAMNLRRALALAG